MPVARPTCPLPRLRPWAAARAAGTVLLLAGPVGPAACRNASAAGAAARDAALADTLTREIVDAYDFSRAGVPARLLGLYPARGPVVSAAGGGVTTSRAALAAEVTRFWTRVGQNMRGARFEVRERHLTTLGPDAAALTLTYAIPHHTPEGRPHTLAGAWTAVFRRDGGRWVIVQEHLSDAPPRAEPAAGDSVAEPPSPGAHGHHTGPPATGPAGAAPADGVGRR